MHRAPHPDPYRMSPQRSAEIDRRGARWVFSMFCLVTAIALLAGEWGIGGILALLILSVAISQIPPCAPPARKPRSDEPPAPPKGLMRAPTITPRWAERLTGAPAIACGIAALFLIMISVGLLIG